MRRISPQRENSSWICSSVVKNDILPTYKVVELRSKRSCSWRDPYINGTNKWKILKMANPNLIMALFDNVFEVKQLIGYFGGLPWNAGHGMSSNRPMAMLKWPFFQRFSTFGVHDDFCLFNFYVCGCGRASVTSDKTVKCINNIRWQTHKCQYVFRKCQIGKMAAQTMNSPRALQIWLQYRHRRFCDANTSLRNGNSIQWKFGIKFYLKLKNEIDFSYFVNLF